ncbi:sensor histidine kinase [Inhella sp.]|uniref:sensor histidine kinase n=1 Tax=Inhella sp. TaxID=1921806 RepID=UPI0035B21B6F
MLPASPRRWLPPYLAGLLAMGLLLSFAALQDYRRAGGRHAWEPFLWEFSSIVMVGLLALALHQLVGRLRGRPWTQQLPALLLAALLFNLLHVAGMFGLRLAVYAGAGLDYQPDPLPELLLYEGAKDLVAFGFLLLASRGFWAAQAAAAQAQELERTRRELAEARLARLAEQVQPHFLFNSLNLISSLMYEDVERADRLLCELAGLLRASLAAQEQGEHTLEAELALVQPFLNLMQARFGAERLLVQIDADAEARACRLPALLLLAPVENAIKHDVARHAGLVRVRLQALRRADQLCLQLDNDGVREAPPVDGGLGLRNLRERLQARYGVAAQVEFGPAEGLMRLRITIPQGV